MKRQKSVFKENNSIKVICLIVLLVILSLTIGYAVFQGSGVIKDVGATIRVQKNIRVTGVKMQSSTSEGTSNYEEYNVSNISSGLNLPNSSSTITYAVEITNFGNVDMAISSISGLSNNLKYTIDEENYKLKEKICSDTDSTKCTLGAKKTLYITIGYKDGGYDSSNTTYNMILDLDFKQIFSITYLNITDSNYPKTILEDDSLEVTFVSDIPDDVSVVGASYSYESPKLTLSNPTDNVEVNSSIYFRHYDELVFDGTNYVDTKIPLFSEQNIGKNFEISFEITEVGENQNSQATILNAMKEVSPYPGFVFRVQTNNTQYEFNSPKISARSGININSTEKILIKRLNDVYYLQVNDNALQTLGTYEYGETFDVPLVIGASINSNGNAQRYFKGTLSNVDIRLSDSEVYTVKFHANGGSGSVMSNQIIRENESVNLKANEYTKNGYVFDGWNTKEDGSGTTYQDEEEIENIANVNETVDLYAIWVKEFNYNVEFNSNGGIGTMDPLEFKYGTSKNLSANTYTNGDKTFVRWNTKADGTGTNYYAGQSVKNLTKTENDTVVLYAVWADVYYSYPNEFTFTGSNNIDTNIKLFSQSNINKDFEVSFNIVKRNTAEKQATILSSMDESGSPWPGMVYRITGSGQEEFGANVTTSIKFQKSYQSYDISKVTIKRINRVLYICFNDAACSRALDMTSLQTTFDSPLTFGSSLDASGNPQRYFKGILSNMEVIVY